MRDHERGKGPAQTAHHQKKGDFHETSRHTDSVGGNQKAHEKGESDSRTGSKQNAGHGGHK